MALRDRTNLPHSAAPPLPVAVCLAGTRAAAPSRRPPAPPPPQQQPAARRPADDEGAERLRFSPVDYQVPEGWPALPPSPEDFWRPAAAPAGGDAAGGPIRRSRRAAARAGGVKNNKWVMVDMLPLERVPIPRFDDFDIFSRLTHSIRAQYFGEQYYVLDLVDRVHRIPAWCYYLAPPGCREI